MLISRHENKNAKYQLSTITPIAICKHTEPCQKGYYKKKSNQLIKDVHNDN